MRQFLLLIFLLSSHLGNAQISAIPLNFDSDSIVWSTYKYPLLNENVLVNKKTAYLNGKEMFNQSYFDEKQLKSLEYFTSEFDMLLHLDVHGNRLNSFCINYHSDTISKCYDFDSSMKLQSTFNDYERYNGTKTEYFPSGQLKSISEIKNGLKHGNYWEYWENGVLKEFSTLREGELLTYVELNPDGIMTFQIIYLADNVKKHLIYNNQGDVSQYRLYKDDKLIETKTY